MKFHISIESLSTCFPHNMQIKIKVYWHSPFGDTLTCDAHGVKNIITPMETKTCISHNYMLPLEI